MYAALDCMLDSVASPACCQSPLIFRGGQLFWLLGVTVLQPQLSDCVVGAVAGLHLLSLSFCPGF